MNVKELKVGDRVGYGRSGSWGDLHSTGFGTVSKINGHGHVTVERETKPGGGFDSLAPLVFDKRGNERTTSGYGGKHLMDAAWLEGHLAREKAKRDAYAAAKAIITELESHKNGRGDYCISAETKAKLAELVAALPVNYTEG